MGEAREAVADRRAAELGKALGENASATLDRIEAKVKLSVAQKLTKEQIALLQWIADGKQNSDIAQIEGVKPIAIQSRVGKILDTVGVCTRSAAVAYGFRNGLLK